MKSPREGTKTAHPAPEKPRLNRRERSKLDKLERIRKAAAALFKKQGFERTTTQAVADAADIGSGTLFFYARTKEDLLGIVMAGDLLEIVGEFAHKSSSDAGPPEQAMQLFAALLKYHARDKELSRFYVREFNLPRRIGGSPRPGHPSPALAILNVLSKQVNAAQEKGLVRRDMKAEDIAMALFSLYITALSQFLMGRMTLETTSTYLRGALKGHFEGVQAR
jgi:TetR/AcrR family transcriptional regulator, cholesterol catabolism regulator